MKVVSQRILDCRIGLWGRVLAAGCLISGTACGAYAGNFILGVDFGTNSSTVESGFQRFGVGTGETTTDVTKSYTDLDSTLTSGTVSINLSNAVNSSTTMTSRDRTGMAAISDTGTFTYGGLYYDFINLTGTGSIDTMAITISGLLANTQYSLTFYAYDDNNSRTMTFTDYTSGTAGVSGSITYTRDTAFNSSTLNDIYSTTLIVTADATGKIVIRDKASGGGAVISGLTIAEIPEPATLGIGAISLISLVISRKRRQV